MRKTWFALLALSCVVADGRGQPSPPAGKPAAAVAAPLDPRNPLDNYLVRWEQSMRRVTTLALACSRTETDPVHQTRTVYSGSIHFLKPTYFFWDMKRVDKPQEFERFICTGQYIYQYVPQQRELRVYPAPKPGPNGGLAEDSSVAFLFGMKAEQAKKRYTLSLFKEDKNYVYVDVVPRLEVDKADFEKARIILDKETFLPRKLWFQHPNSGQVVWDIPTIQSGVKLPASVFAAPSTPKGWKLVQGQTPAAGSGTTRPSVYRPKN